jgi:hypothetical protein
MGLSRLTGHGSDEDEYLSGWRDLNSRPLDPQIGPPRLSSVNYCSLASVVDR